MFFFVFLLTLVENVDNIFNLLNNSGVGGDNVCKYLVYSVLYSIC